MENITLAGQALNGFLDERDNFFTTIDKTFKTKEDRAAHRDSIFIFRYVITHYYRLRYLLKPLEGKVDEQDIRYLLIVLAALFVSKLGKDPKAKEEIKTEAFERFKDHLDVVKPLLDAEALPPQVSLNKGEKATKKEMEIYLMTHFNAPMWVIKILHHFGLSMTFNVLKNYINPPITTLRVRTSRIKIETLLEKYKGILEETEIPNLLLYKGSKSLYTLDEFRNGLLYEIKPVVKHLLDTYTISEPSELLIYNGNAANKNVLKELLETYGNTVGMNLAVPSTHGYEVIKNTIKKNHLTNVNFFSAKPNAMEASISRPVDLAICAPDNTFFDLITTNPGYFVNFDTSTIDEILKRQEDALEGVSKYVNNKGTLLYFVNTINKKEGEEQINKFVANHPEFHIVKMEQLFPCKGDFNVRGNLFYCVMQKDENTAVAADPAIIQAQAPQSESVPLMQGQK